MCPFCSGVLTQMYSRVIPIVAADDLNSRPVCWIPLSARNVKPDLGWAAAVELYPPYGFVARGAARENKRQPMPGFLPKELVI